MPPLIGLILDGGEGRRLGGIRKGDLRLGNVTLARRAFERLAAQCDRVVYSTGPATRLPQGAEGAIALPDDPAGVSGPAAGLLAGARWCNDNMPGALMVSMSVDTPFFPTDFAARALPLLGPDSGCVVGSFGGRDYPTTALWCPAPLVAYLETIAPAPRGPRLRDVQAAMGPRTLDYTALCDDNPFAGINTLHDLLAFARRA